MGTCLLWNYDEVLEVLQAAGNVVATFSGHTHRVRAFARALQVLGRAGGPNCGVYARMCLVSGCNQTRRVVLCFCWAISVCMW